MSETQIPDTWAMARLDEIAEITLGQSPPGASYNSNGAGLPFFQGKAEFGELHPAARKWTTAATKTAQPGDILLSVRAPVGPTNIALNRCAIGRGLASIRARDGVSQRFLLHALRGTAHQLASRATGSTFGAVSGAVVREHLVPIPPLAEQHRIVEALEDHLSRLEAGTKNLIHAASLVPLQLRSLNTTAAEGVLLNDTECIAPDFQVVREEIWRRTNPSKKYKEPCEPDLSTPIKAPENWRIASLEAVTDPVRLIRYGILMPKVKSGGTVPYVEVKDLQGCDLRGKALHLTSQELDEKFAGARITEGDVLLAVRGSYDRSAPVPKEMSGANLSRDVARLSPLPGLETGFLQIYLQSNYAQQYLKRHARGVAVKGVNISSIRSLPIAIPPTATQKAIVAAWEAEISVINNASRFIAKSRTASARLRNALLYRAFSGGLVPQSPTDEPASVLLARIRTERDVAPKPKRARRTSASTRRPNAKTTDRELPPPPVPSSTPAPQTAVQQEFQL
ncbi:restriction endonuclease subunit S [Streptomyces sp. BH104]|uniref:restriction endonuclease subunit S n=1 Tax=Streptomyces sp. BH104 TaxID=3410407 RepID=UPI003BB52065